MRVGTRGFAFAVAALAFTAVTGFAARDLARADPAPEATKAEAGEQRILSLGGDVTEILYDLGQSQKIVAVDTTSQFPADALKEKKSVGYLRALSAEGVLSVNPTLIIASEQAGPPEVVKAIRGSGVRYIDISEKPTAEGVPDKIRHIGSVIGAEAEANTLASKVEAEFAALEKDRKEIKQRKKVLFILAVQDGRATVAGTGTSADSILQLAGADNAAADIKGYKPVSDEQLIELAPEAIVMMKRGDKDPHAVSKASGLTGLTQTPAGKAHKFIEMDGLYLLGFGPRAPSAARDLMTSLYADASQPAAMP